MTKFKDLSIRKKLLISMLTFSLLLVGAVTGVTFLSFDEETIDL